MDLMKENGLTKMYSKETITDINYDPARLANTLAQTECLLQSLEQAPRGIGFYVNSDKTKFTCFKRACAIST